MSRRKSRPIPPSEPVELDLYGFTHGGEAVGRRDDGKVCFVPYAIPGERVRVQVEVERASWSRGRVLEVLEASLDRVEPPCPYAQPGACGGCTLQHVRPARQAELLRQVVIDQLERIGHLVDPPVSETLRPHDGDGLGYRSWARFSVDPEGRLGFHRHSSDDVMAIDHCRLLTAQAHRVRTEAGDDWAGAEAVVVRAGTEERGLVEVTPGEGSLATLPAGEHSLALVDASGVGHGIRGEPFVDHVVHDHTFRVSATSFFQPSVAAAHLLVNEVMNAAQVQPGDHVLDLYSGVGLFSWFLAESGAQVTAVEGNPSAVRDAEHNLSELDVDIIRGDVAVNIRAHPARVVDTVVLDPSRQGAGTQLCTDIARLGATRVVYVACDPAALARDAAALVHAGYELIRVVPVDQFTHTGHIEAVATFHRF